MAYIRDTNFDISAKQYTKIESLLGEGDSGVLSIMELWLKQAVEFDEIVDTLFLLETCRFKKKTNSDVKHPPFITTDHAKGNSAYP